MRVKKGVNLEGLSWAAGRGGTRIYFKYSWKGEKRNIGFCLLLARVEVGGQLNYLPPED